MLPLKALHFNCCKRRNENPFESMVTTAWGRNNIAASTVSTIFLCKTKMSIIIIQAHTNRKQNMRHTRDEPWYYICVEAVPTNPLWQFLPLEKVIASLPCTLIACIDKNMFIEQVINEQLSLQQTCDPTWNQVWIKSYMWISIWWSNSANLLMHRYADHAKINSLCVQTDRTQSSSWLQTSTRWHLIKKHVHRSIISRITVW
jgi:hypothetical protein